MLKNGSGPSIILVPDVFYISLEYHLKTTQKPLKNHIILFKSLNYFSYHYKDGTIETDWYNLDKILGAENILLDSEKRKEKERNKKWIV